MLGIGVVEHAVRSGWSGFLSPERSPKTANNVVDNQVSRGRVVTRKVSENCELDSDTRFAGIIDARSILD